MSPVTGREICTSGLMSQTELLTATQLAQKAQVSKETGHSLALITDPFHDHSLIAEGFPDGKAVFSVIRRRNLRKTIACPFVLANGESWDFHVFTTPLHDYESLKIGAVTDGGVQDLAAGVVGLGPINVICRHYGANGAMLNVVVLPWVPPYDVVPQGAAKARTVSLGYEIHDTSPEINKMGSISSYRLNDTVSLLNSRKVGTPNIAFSYTLTPAIPESLNEIVMLPNAKTWELEKGVYSVSLPVANNPFEPLAANNLVVRIPSIMNSQNCAFRDVLESAAVLSWSQTYCSGSMSSLLTSDQLTYVLDVRQIIELVPLPNSTLLSYASGSPEYNHQFMKLYKALVHTLPCATFVGNNDSGDWFRNIVALVRQIAPLVIQALPPQAKTVAMLAAPVADVVLKKVEQRLDKKKSPGATAPAKKNGKKT